MMTARESLDREMAAVLAQLALCSHTPAAGYGVRGVSSDEHPGGRRPPGDVGAHVFERWYGEPFHTCSPRCKHKPSAVNDDDRRAVVKDARAELAHLRGHGEREAVAVETLDELKKRIVKEGEGWTVREVALRMRCGQRVVRDARAAAGREPDLGKLPEPAPDVEARRARARSMAANGYTLAQIARLLDVSRSTVERDLGRGGRQTSEARLG